MAVKNLKLRNRLLREIVHDAIRSRIVKGEFGAGALLSEVELAQSLQASRTPVREALMQLEQEGLVEIVPRRGPVVRHISPYEMSDLLMVRESLEGLAVQLAANRMPLSQIQEMKDDWKEMRLHLNDATRDAVFDKCEEFHQTIIEAAQSPVISKLIGSIRDRIASSRQLYLRPHGRPEMHRLERSCAEHLSIIEALEVRDASRCEVLLREHLRALSHEILDAAAIRMKATVQL